MKTETVKLSQIAINKENPRTITGEKFQKLVESILILPKMLEIRPIVVDKTMKVLGGNMRTDALNQIAKMDATRLSEVLYGIKDYQKLSQTAKDALVAYWGKWQDNPVVTIIKADDLTTDEKKQFVIKDNASFGVWNYDILANKWDNEDLINWGLDVWNTQTDVNIDSFFEEHSNNDESTSAPSHDSHNEVITIAIPESLRGKKDDIVYIIKTSLSDYPELIIR